jgi:hypothetical protein
VGLRVGWADRNEGLVAFAASVARRSGHEVAWFADHASLLAAHGPSPFDVVVLRTTEAADPLNANAVLRGLREATPDTVVALCSGCVLEPIGPAEHQPCCGGIRSAHNADPDLFDRFFAKEAPGWWDDVVAWLDALDREAPPPLTVAVVEDEPALRAVMGRILERAFADRRVRVLEGETATRPLCRSSQMCGWRTFGATGPHVGAQFGPDVRRGPQLALEGCDSRQRRAIRDPAHRRTCSPGTSGGIPAGSRFNPPERQLPPRPRATGDTPQAIDSLAASSSPCDAPEM